MRDQDFLFGPFFSNNFSLKASLKNSVTPLYPFSGCFFMKSSTSSYKSSGMLNVLYFDIHSLCVRHNINNMCYRYGMHNTTFNSTHCVNHNICLQEEAAA